MIDSMFCILMIHVEGHSAVSPCSFPKPTTPLVPTVRNGAEERRPLAWGRGEVGTELGDEAEGRPFRWEGNRALLEAACLGLQTHKLKLQSRCGHIWRKEV